MDTTEIKSLITQTQFTLLGRSIDARSLTYWVNIIASGKCTINNFIESIISSNEYELYVVSLFKDDFYSIIGYVEIETYLEDFISYMRMYVKDKNKPLKETDIKNFITKLPCFKEKFTNLIKIEYKAKFNTECDETIIQFHLDNFNNKYNYNTETLLKEVALYSSVEKNQQHSIIDLIEKNATKVSINESDLQDFYTVFGRPMFVEEYFYYVINENKTSYQLIFEEYSINFNRYTKIIYDFKNKKPTEYDFIKSYIPFNELHKDNESYFVSIVDDIINSKEYEEEMNQIITKKYYSLYNESLENDDRDYYFSIIKKLKINLRDDRVEIELMKLKNETDEYIGNIFEIYMKVLDRKPDVVEIATLLKKYRDLNDIENVNIYVEKNLVTSIEFNEIIKRKIKENNPDIIPSKLYSIMNDTIKKINIADMMYDDVCDMIGEITY